MSFAGKWVELGIIMLSAINQAQKAKYHVFSYMKSKSKMIMTNSNNNECKRGEENEKVWSGVKRLKVYCIHI
jgi:hypothetical protein